LYAMDPIASTLSFEDGIYGSDITDWSVYNRDSEIDFNEYYAGNFSVGMQGDQVGRIIDLGTTEDLQKKYKYRETVSNGQGYASIHRQGQTLLIIKEGATAYDKAYQRMEESDELFRQGKSLASASVKLGHIYVLR